MSNFWIPPRQNYCHSRLSGRTARHRQLPCPLLIYVNRTEIKPRHTDSSHEVNLLSWWVRGWSSAVTHKKAASVCDKSVVLTEVLNRIRLPSQKSHLRGDFGRFLPLINIKIHVIYRRTQFCSFFHFANLNSWCTLKRDRKQHPKCIVNNEWITLPRRRTCWNGGQEAERVLCRIQTAPYDKSSGNSSTLSHFHYIGRRGNFTHRNVIKQKLYQQSQRGKRP